MNRTWQFVTSLVTPIIGLKPSIQFILYWSSYRMELLPMKTCERFERWLDQLRQRPAIAGKKVRTFTMSSRFFLYWAVTRATSNEQSATSSRDALIIPLEQPWDSAAMTHSATHLPRWKRNHRQWLTRNDILRIVKLMLQAVNDDNTDQDAGGVETSTETEENDKLVTQELQNTIIIHP